jgi:hypothetical protein
MICDDAKWKLQHFLLRTVTQISSSSGTRPNRVGQRWKSQVRVIEGLDPPMSGKSVSVNTRVF